MDIKIKDFMSDKKKHFIDYLKEIENNKDLV